MSQRKSKPVETGHLLRDLPLAECLEAAQLEAVAQRCRERVLSRGEILFHRGDPTQGFYGVLEGQIKLAFSAPDGNEKVVELVGARQCFGQIAMLTGATHLLIAEAMCDSRVVLIPREVTFELLDSHPCFARQMLQDMAQRSRDLLQDVETYTQQTSAQRVVSYLHQHCQDAATPTEKFQITLPASKQIIASRLSLTPETLSRIFHELSAAELIDVHGKQITIHNISRLRAYAS
ncbi:MAG: hypothetical protein RIR00_1823 [Pseudomonadota bacterium]|jgi:CRP-like cAMP-binding protein